MRDRLRKVWGWVKNKWRTEFTFKPLVFTAVALILSMGVMILIWKVGAPGKEVSTMVDEITKLERDPILGTRLTLTVGALGALSLAIVGLWNFFVNHRRARTAEKQQTQELFVDSIRNLGNENEIIRIGAIHGLGQLAKDLTEIWSEKVAEILCDFIRSITLDHNYENDYPSKSPVEINVALKILTQDHDNPFDSAKIDLDFANLKRTGLELANLHKASLREVNFTEAYLWGANLSEAHMYRTSLVRAYLLGVDLSEANLKEAILIGAYLIGANLRGAFLGTADLTGANLQGADLRDANLADADLSEVNLKDVQLTGANLGGVCLNEAARLTRDKNKWPDFMGCEFDSKLGNPTSFKGIYWGVLTEGLENAIKKDQATLRRDNENRYLAENAVTRELTQGEKEYLVGKDNVDKCEWGEVGVLEG